MSVEKSLLGKETDYPTTYQPNILFPILRATARQNYQHVPHIEHGVDWWHVFELSWLNTNNFPQVAIGRLTIPATSIYLIESKSLKLYFNSLNFTSFDSQDHLIQTVQDDLSKVAQAQIHLDLIDVNGLHVDQPSGQCIDHLTPSKHALSPDPSLLSLASDEQEIVEEQLHCNLLRSNCPVTGQPDWGTLFIRYRGQKINHASLLAYIISFREHNGFHEQCVEQIFAEVWQVLKPEQLMVYAAYTRRGGLDINPCRSSHWAWIPTIPLRLARQ
ncbi:NADPH-dependent 7-cyano-7-deazaguanine reductase QueF [Acinetobacter sp. B5B]|uniref:NADPH-dependent 7-cyano-7-deazaguanine reductase QueF n=1 Tax=Acinetobacter baretiae TaxID=2605383 RepID=UPI0018C335B9|nr:NADPH-dependent 7-cyano-7-deazaguanine reductase QueF [Acinetobacter baretiae]MBF7681992.1 NADPH-dependent 7-cyano-7-deazaguanine reductase QueF [Acinetobacter baretiae]